jgi:hypothetical protein
MSVRNIHGNTSDSSLDLIFMCDYCNSLLKTNIWLDWCFPAIMKTKKKKVAR